MPEMLPCPLSMNRYNQTFKATEDDEVSQDDEDLSNGEEDNYLDPERDYDLINSLRQGLMNNGNLDEMTMLEDAHYVQADFHHQQ
jgi:hypothetical protein